MTLSFEPDELIQNFADNQGISIEDVELSIEEILEQEIAWIEMSGISISDLEAEREIIGRTNCCMSPIYK